MKTKAKIYFIAVSLGLLSTQAFTASSGINQGDHFRFDRTNPAGQDVIVENNYYGDGDYIYDYYYASRIRRFHKPYVSYSYYNSYYTDCYWYTYEPSFWGMSIYLGSMWNPVGLSISFGFPYRSYYQSYYYNPYPLYPVYNIVYRPRIVNRYYYNTWYGNRIRYHRPYYANRYNYFNNYRDNYRDGYYSHSYKHASNVVPSRASASRDNNRNSNVINSSRRSSPTNTSRTGNYNRNAEKNRQVVSNSDVGRRNTASDRTVIENRNSNRNVTPVTKTNRSDENRRIVTNTRRNTPVPNNNRDINSSQRKTETRRSTYVPSKNRSSRAVYKAPQKNSNRTRISKPAKNNRSSSYRAPVKTKKSKSDQKKSSGRKR